MVKVINVTGEAVAANTNINLGAYLEDKIAQLVKARLLSRAADTHGHVLGIEVTGATWNTTLGLMDSAGKLASKTATGTMATAIQKATIAGLAFAEKTVDNTGLLIAAGVTCAAGHAALSDRTAIILGDALASNALLQLTVLYEKDFGGLV